MTLNRKKKRSYFQSCRTDIQSGVKLFKLFTCLFLQSRQVGRTFKLVNPKHKGRASVRNDSFSLNLLVC